MEQKGRGKCLKVNISTLITQAQLLPDVNVRKKEIIHQLQALQLRFQSTGDSDFSLVVQKGIKGGKGGKGKKRTSQDLAALNIPARPSSRPRTVDPASDVHSV